MTHISMRSHVSEQLNWHGEAHLCNVTNALTLDLQAPPVPVACAG